MTKVPASKERLALLSCLGYSEYNMVNTYKMSPPAMSLNPDRMPENVASDQDLHCLLTENSKKFEQQ